MISKITKKEFNSLSEKQRNGFHSCLLFSLYDGYYKCDILGAKGIKEIMTYRKEKKKIKDDQLDLLGIKKVVS